MKLDGYVWLIKKLSKKGLSCSKRRVFSLFAVGLILASFEAKSDNATVKSLKEFDPPPLRLTNSVVPPLPGIESPSSQAPAVQSELNPKITGTGNPTVESLKEFDPLPPREANMVVPSLPSSDSQLPEKPAVQSGIDRKLWIQKVLLKIDRMRNDAEAQIKKADASILAGQGLLSQAQAQKNTKIEMAVRQTIAQAREVKKKNELNKARAEEAIARVRNLLAKMSNENIPVQAVVSHVSGSVFLKDRNGKFAPLNENRTYLEPGDRVQTLANSRAEFQMLEGEGTVTMGPNTSLMVTSDGLERETIDVLNGAVRMLKAKIINSTKKLQVRMSSGTASVRGTEFLVTVTPDQASEIVLLEGKLEVQPLNKTNSVLLEAGQRILMPITGAVSTPVAIDLKTVNRWWDDN